MVRDKALREGELAVEISARTRRRPRLHRPHPHALDLAPGYAAAGPPRRPGLPARNLRTVGAGAEGCRFLFEPRSDLLAASVAPRSGAAEPETQPVRARHILAALAAAAEPDRHLGRQAGQGRGQHGVRARARLPRRDAADRFEARPLRIFSAGGAGGGGFQRRDSRCCYPEVGYCFSFGDGASNPASAPTAAEPIATISAGSL